MGSVVGYGARGMDKSSPQCVARATAGDEQDFQWEIVLTPKPGRFRLSQYLNLYR